MGEYFELTNVNCPNPNQQYRKALAENQSIFARKTGIFSHMYDAAARFGNITMPFDKPLVKDGRPAFKWSITFKFITLLQIKSYSL